MLRPLVQEALVHDDDGMQRATDVRERFPLVISLITFRSKVPDNVSRLMHGD